MRLQRLLPLFAALLLWPASAAADMIDRTLPREAAYSAKPHYCLLLFGPEGKTRVWLVVAGEALYADTSGNNDLTAAGKRIYSIGNYRSLVWIDPCIRLMWLPVPEDVRVYDVGDLFEPATRTWYHLTVRRLGKLETAHFQIEAAVRGQYRHLAELPHFGADPKTAPVLHVGGPLTLGLFPSQLVRGTNAIAAWIGTAAPRDTKGEPTYLILDDWVPPDLSPTAQVELPAALPGGEPIRSTVRLDRREGLVRFTGRIRVPEEAGPGKATIRLSIPGWTGTSVRPAVVEVPIVEAQGKGATSSGM